MFVGCVVAGSVMLACQGAKVRGALIRDVAAYAIAASSVALILWSGKVPHIPVYPLSTAHVIALPGNRVNSRPHLEA